MCRPNEHTRAALRALASENLRLEKVQLTSGTAPEAALQRQCSDLSFRSVRSRLCHRIRPMRALPNHRRLFACRFEGLRPCRGGREATTEPAIFPGMWTASPRSVLPPAPFGRFLKHPSSYLRWPGSGCCARWIREGSSTARPAWREARGAAG